MLQLTFDGQKLTHAPDSNWELLAQAFAEQYPDYAKSPSHKKERHIAIGKLQELRRLTRGSRTAPVTNLFLNDHTGEIILGPNFAGAQDNPEYNFYNSVLNAAGNCHLSLDISDDSLAEGFLYYYLTQEKRLMNYMGVPKSYWPLFQQNSIVSNYIAEVLAWQNHDVSAHKLLPSELSPYGAAVFFTRHHSCPDPTSLLPSNAVHSKKITEIFENNPKNKNLWLNHSFGHGIDFYELFSLAANDWLVEQTLEHHQALRTDFIESTKRFLQESATNLSADDQRFAVGQALRYLIRVPSLALPEALSLFLEKFPEITTATINDSYAGKIMLYLRGVTMEYRPATPPSERFDLGQLTFAASNNNLPLDWGAENRLPEIYVIEHKENAPANQAPEFIPLSTALKTLMQNQEIQTLLNISRRDLAPAPGLAL